MKWIHDRALKQIAKRSCGVSFYGDESKIHLDAYLCNLLLGTCLSSWDWTQYLEVSSNCWDSMICMYRYEGVHTLHVFFIAVGDE